jgi:predicted nucleic acid-binding protein
VSGLRADELGTTAVTVAEIRHGIERLPDGRRKEGLLSAATDLFAAFGQLVQPFDALAAAWFGPLMVRRVGLGLPIEGLTPRSQPSAGLAEQSWPRGTSRISLKPV